MGGGTPATMVEGLGENPQHASDGAASVGASTAGAAAADSAQRSASSSSRRNAGRSGRIGDEAKEALSVERARGLEEGAPAFPERHGWLLKRGRFNRTYKKRYFHLALMRTTGDGAAEEEVSSEFGAASSGDWSSTSFDSDGSRGSQSGGVVKPVLRYFEDIDAYRRGDASRGSVEITVTTIATASDKGSAMSRLGAAVRGKSAFKFRIVTKRRTWVFAALSEADREAWIGAVQTAAQRPAAQMAHRYDMASSPPSQARLEVEATANNLVSLLPKKTSAETKSEATGGDKGCLDEVDDLDADDIIIVDESSVVADDDDDNDRSGGTKGSASDDAGIVAAAAAAPPVDASLGVGSEAGSASAASAVHAPSIHSHPTQGPTMEEKSSGTAAPPPSTNVGHTAPRKQQHPYPHRERHRHHARKPPPPVLGFDEGSVGIPTFPMPPDAREKVPPADISNAAASSADLAEESSRYGLDAHLEMAGIGLLAANGSGGNGAEEGDMPWVDVGQYLLQQAVSTVTPEVHRGDVADIRAYVNIETCAGGMVSDCQYIDGVICNKNIAHRKMRRRILQPRIVLLRGALEFMRSGQRLASLETLHDQEDEYVSILVAKVASLQPDVLFVERTVSRKAQEQLLARGVTLVLNVDRTQLVRIARLTGGLMLASIDHIDKVPSKAVVGTCALFSTRRLAEAGTHIFLEGCDRRLGCTLLLRGANEPTLRRVKVALERTLFEAYSRRLQLAVLRDMRVSIHRAPQLAAVAGNDAGHTGHMGGGVNSLHRDIYFNSCWMGGTMGATVGARATTVPTQCSAAKVKHVQMYGTRDRALGDYLRRYCFKLSRCADTKCKRNIKNHEQHYFLGRGRVCVTVVPLARPLSLVLPFPSEHGRGGPDGSRHGDDRNMQAPALPPRCLEEIDMHFRALAASQRSRGGGAVGGGQQRPRDAQVEHARLQGLANIDMLGRNGDPVLPIWMWGYCFQCKKVVSPFTLMSGDTWRSSFGKFLQMHFRAGDDEEGSTAELADRLRPIGSQCEHDVFASPTFLHLFTDGSKVAQFRYSSVGAYDLCGPIYAEDGIFAGVPRLGFDTEGLDYMRRRYLGQMAMLAGETIDAFVEAVTQRVIELKQVVLSNAPVAPAAPAAPAVGVAEKASTVDANRDQPSGDQLAVKGAATGSEHDGHEGQAGHEGKPDASNPQQQQELEQEQDEEQEQDGDTVGAATSADQHTEVASATEGVAALADGHLLTPQHDTPLTAENEAQHEALGVIDGLQALLSQVESARSLWAARIDNLAVVAATACGESERSGGDGGDMLAINMVAREMVREAVHWNQQLVGLHHQAEPHLPQDSTVSEWPRMGARRQTTVPRHAGGRREYNFAPIHDRTFSATSYKSMMAAQGGNGGAPNVRPTSSSAISSASLVHAGDGQAAEVADTESENAVSSDDVMSKAAIDAASGAVIEEGLQEGLPANRDADETGAAQVLEPEGSSEVTVSEAKDGNSTSINVDMSDSLDLTPDTTMYARAHGGSNTSNGHIRSTSKMGGSGILAFLKRTAADRAENNPWVVRPPPELACRANIDLPVGHGGLVIPIVADQIGSPIAHALASEHYNEQLNIIARGAAEKGEFDLDILKARGAEFDPQPDLAEDNSSRSVTTSASEGDGEGDGSSSGGRGDEGEGVDAGEDGPLESMGLSSFGQAAASGGDRASGSGVAEDAPGAANPFDAFDASGVGNAHRCGGLCTHSTLDAEQYESLMHVKRAARRTRTHITTDGMRYSCSVYFPLQFYALRQLYVRDERLFIQVRMIV
jgi:hypothetical protein